MVEPTKTFVTAKPIHSAVETTIELRSLRAIETAVTLLSTLLSTLLPVAAHLILRTAMLRCLVALVVPIIASVLAHLVRTIALAAAHVLELSFNSGGLLANVFQFVFETLNVSTTAIPSIGGSIRTAALTGTPIVLSIGVPLLALAVAAWLAIARSRRRPLGRPVFRASAN